MPSIAEFQRILPPPDLVERLLKRVDPPDYYVGANSHIFRSIRHVTLFARPPFISSRADFHHRHVVVIGLQEPLYVLIGSKELLIQGGDAVVIPPFELHGYRDAGAGRVPLAFIGFEADMGTDAPDGITLGSTAGMPVRMSSEAWRIFDLLEQNFDETPALAPALVLNLLEYLLGQDPQPVASHVGYMQWKRTSTLAHFAREQPFADVSDLARAVGLSEAVLRQAVAATTGMPVAKFVRRLRLRASLPWLTRRELSRAAEAAGYETQEAYTKAFKAEFGLPPSKFSEMTVRCTVYANLK